MRRILVLVGAVLLLAVLILGAAFAKLHSLASGSSVPIAAVRRTRFVHRVMAEGYLQEVESTAIKVPGRGDSFKIAWLLPDGTLVRKGDLLLRFDPSEVEKDIVEGNMNLAVVENKIAKLQIESGAVLRSLDRAASEADLSLAAARQFQGRDPDLFSRSQILEDEFDTALAEHSRDHSLGVRKDREIVARVALDLLRLERTKVVSRIATAERIRAELEVRAPHEGLVLFATHDDGRPMAVGETAWSGDVIAGLPKLDQVEAVVYVLEADAGGLAVSRSGTVIVESVPDVVVSARVKRVDALPKPRRQGVPVQYFEAVLELELIDLSFMKPGLRVRSTIVLEDLPDVLVLPRETVFDRGGRSFVYRKTAEGFETVDVVIGSSSPSQIVVKAGLEESDLVALRDPTRSLEEILPSGVPGPPALETRR